MKKILLLLLTFASFAVQGQDLYQYGAKRTTLITEQKNGRSFSHIHLSSRVSNDCYRDNIGIEDEYYTRVYSNPALPFNYLIIDDDLEDLGFDNQDNEKYVIVGPQSHLVRGYDDGFYNRRGIPYAFGLDDVPFACGATVSGLTVGPTISETRATETSIGTERFWINYEFNNHRPGLRARVIATNNITNEEFTARAYGGFGQSGSVQLDAIPARRAGERYTFTLEIEEGGATRTAETPIKHGFRFLDIHAQGIRLLISAPTAETDKFTLDRIRRADGEFNDVDSGWRQFFRIPAQANRTWNNGLTREYVIPFSRDIEQFDAIRARVQRGSFDQTLIQRNGPFIRKYWTMNRVSGSDVNIRVDFRIAWPPGWNTNGRNVSNLRMDFHQSQVGHNYTVRSWDGGRHRFNNGSSVIDRWGNGHWNSGWRNERHSDDDLRTTITFTFRNRNYRVQLTDDMDYGGHGRLSETSGSSRRGGGALQQRGTNGFSGTRPGIDGHRMQVSF